MRLRIHPTLFFLLLASGAGAGQSGRAWVLWEGDLSSALARAKRWHRPVLVAMHGAEAPGSLRMIREVYRDPEIRDLLREMVCLVGCEKPFPPIEEGPRKGRCSVFLTVTTEETRRIATEIKKRYLGDLVTLPQHLLLHPLGHLVSRKEGFLSAKDLSVLLEKALDQVDPAWRPRGTGKTEVGPRNTRVEDETNLSWEGLFDRDPVKRRAAALRLLEVKDQRILLRMYPQVTYPDMKAQLLDGLRQKNEKLDWAIGLMKEALGDREPSVRTMAAHLAELARLDGSAALGPKLLSVARKEKDPAALSAQLHALARRMGSDKGAREFLMRSLRNKNQRVRKNAYIALSNLPNDKKVVETLMKKGLRNQDGPVRSAAVWSLGQLGEKKAIPAIRKLLERTNRKWRRDFYDLAIRKLEGEKPGFQWMEVRRRITEEGIQR